MSTKTKSPRDAQRVRLFEHYRGLGQLSGNLFLVYSIKTSRDWVLPSDRHFIHWLRFLETDLETKTFEIESSANENGPSVVNVLRRNGRREIHLIAHSRANDMESYQGEADSLESKTSLGTLRKIYTDADLEPVPTVSLRWLKPISYAAVLREKEYTRETMLVLDYCKAKILGTLGDLVSSLTIDRAVLLGIVVRLAIRGVIQLDLKTHSFGFETPWRLLEEVS